MTDSSHVVVDKCGRTAHSKSRRQYRIRGHGNPWFYFCGEFVTKVEKPSPRKRQIALPLCDPDFPPMLVKRPEEVRHFASDQRFTRERKQNVIAPQ
jgi:hypothetical protein